MPPDAVSALRLPTREPTSRSPLADANLQSAYWPSAAMFADAADALSRDPDGRAMSTTTAHLRGKEKPRWLATASVPLLKSTRTCSAALTS